MNLPKVTLAIVLQYTCYLLHFVCSLIFEYEKSQQVLTEPAAEKSLYSPVFDSHRIDKRHLSIYNIDPFFRVSNRSAALSVIPSYHRFSRMSSAFPCQFTAIFVPQLCQNVAKLFYHFCHKNKDREDGYKLCLHVCKHHFGVASTPGNRFEDLHRLWTATPSFAGPYRSTVTRQCQTVGALPPRR